MGKFLTIMLSFAVALGLFVQEAAVAAANGSTERTSAIEAQDCMEMMQQSPDEDDGSPCDCGFLGCIAMMSGAVAFSIPEMPPAGVAPATAAVMQNGWAAQRLSSHVNSPLPEPPKHLI